MASVHLQTKPAAPTSTAAPTTVSLSNLLARARVCVLVYDSKVLDVRRNFLADLAGLSFLATCASLYSLDLRGNPCHAALTTPASAAAAAAAFHEATSTQDTTPPSSSSSAKHVGLYGSTAAVATSAGAGIAAGAAAAVPAAFPYRGLVLFHLPGLKVLSRRADWVVVLELDCDGSG